MTWQLVVVVVPPQLRGWCVVLARAVDSKRQNVRTIMKTSHITSNVKEVPRTLGATMWRSNRVTFGPAFGRGGQQQQVLESEVTCGWGGQQQQGLESDGLWLGGQQQQHVLERDRQTNRSLHTTGGCRRNLRTPLSVELGISKLSHLSTFALPQHKGSIKGIGARMHACLPQLIYS